MNANDYARLECGIREMDERMAAFGEHLEKASAIVSTWPKWKQELLGGTAADAPAEPGWWNDERAIDAVRRLTAVSGPEWNAWTERGWRDWLALADAIRDDYLSRNPMDIEGAAIRHAALEEAAKIVDDKARGVAYAGDAYRAWIVPALAEAANNIRRRKELAEAANNIRRRKDES